MKSSFKILITYLSAFLFVSSCKPENLDTDKFNQLKQSLLSSYQQRPPKHSDDINILKRDLIIMMGEFSIFRDPEMESIILDWQLKEWRKYGNPDLRNYHKKTSYKNSVIMQRSARRRLYDHNIILRSLYRGKIVHKKKGNLSEHFKNALFLDIGSAILIEEGAPTVRDIFEDDKITKHLSGIVATDINEPGARFIDLYTRERQNLPFPVREVSTRIINADQFFTLTDDLLKNNTPLILRSANSGPDLYYLPKDVKEHLRAVIRAFYDRNLIYFFNKFVLIKFKNQTYFECLGRDSGVGVSHNDPAWEYVNWDERKLSQAFIPETAIAEIQD